MPENPHPSYDQYLSLHLSQSYAAYSKMAALRVAYHRANLLPQLVQQLDAPLLEIGPGFGELLQALLSHGFTAIQAVDISSEVVHHIQKHFPSVTCQKIDNLLTYLNTTPATFQNILMVDVIEHIPKDDLLALLVSARKALSPGGRMIVQTVNMGSPMANNVLYYDLTHTWGYTEMSIRDAFTLAGFSKVEVLGYRFPAGFVGAVRSLLRYIAQRMFWSIAFANGMARMRIMDPALVVVATN